MAQPQPHLLTKGDLRRVEDCVNENIKLADSWKSDQVVIVASSRPLPRLPTAASHNGGRLRRRAPRSHGDGGVGGFCGAC